MCHPPFIHSSGGVYTFDGPDGEKALLSPADPPAWLLNAIRNANGAQRQSANLCDSAVWTQGTRNNSLTALAGKLRYAGLAEDVLIAALLAENQRRCSPPLPDAEVTKIARSVSRYPAGASRTHSAGVPIAACVDLQSFEPSLDLLNSLSVFHGRIEFTAVKRRASMIIATTSAGAEVVWPTAADLATFQRSQGIIADATSILLPTPPHRQIRTQWEAAAHLILKLATADEVTLGSPLKEEIRDLLRTMWRAAGQPCAITSADFIALVRATLRARRDPRGPIPSCVFAAEESVWVHVPSLRAWASIPAITNRIYLLADVRNGLLLLGFTYHENLTRGADGDSETVCLWRGPLDVLEG